MCKENPNYYAIIPANVRYDKRLSGNEKLLYGEITALSNKDGYCWATNQYFANLYGVEKDTISKWIRRLVKFGYLSREVVRDENNQVTGRKLHPEIMSYSDNLNTGSDNSNTTCNNEHSIDKYNCTPDNKNDTFDNKNNTPGQKNDTPDNKNGTPGQKNDTLPLKKDDTPPGQKALDNNTSNINNTSINNNNISLQRKVFDYWIEKAKDTKALVKHTKYSKSYEKAINRAIKVFGNDFEKLKMLIDRFVICFENTQENEYPIRPRTIYQFFGQKVSGGVVLICEEYADDGDKWLKYQKKKIPKTAKKQINNKFNNYNQRDYDFDSLERKAFNQMMNGGW